MINDIILPEIPATWEQWVLLSDTHCGSSCGLNPWPSNPIQEILWQYYMECRTWFGPRPDRLLFNGDATEGIVKFLDSEDPKANSQIEKYCEAIVHWGPLKEYIIITGTGVHNEAAYQNFEYFIADRIKNKHRKYYGEDVEVSVYHKLKRRVNGWFRILARHHINPSRIPQYRATPALREQILHILDEAATAQHENKKAEWAHLTVFGHTHYALNVNHVFGSVLILPGWKTDGAKYGQQKYMGNVQLGVYKLVVSGKEEQEWGLYPHIRPASLISEWEDK